MIVSENLAISFSGGRSSAVMVDLCRRSYFKAYKKVEVTFANTGCEDPDTLRFVNDCDKLWGFNTVWLEAVVTHGKRLGIRHKIVDYESASRSGEPFREVIKKYGIPNAKSPQCTSRLKTEVMESYLKSRGFFRGKKLNYDTAIGIRSDEIDRMSINRVKNRFIYPLVSHLIDKQQVLKLMSEKSFDLRIPEHRGNCVWCWKKSFRKLHTLANEDPKAFLFPALMEKRFGLLKSKSGREDGRRVFFRKATSTQELLKEAAESDFKPFVDPYYLDKTEDCGESCEVYNSTDVY